VDVREQEDAAGVTRKSTYFNFEKTATTVKNNFLAFLIDAWSRGKKVVAYGAAAKGNTLLNYAGVRADLISYVCDVADSKVGKFLPGSHIPIVSVDRLLKDEDVDYVLILPWNIKDEIIENLRTRLSPTVKFVCAIPTLEIM
jgi:hypothetical protein